MCCEIFFFVLFSFLRTSLEHRPVHHVCAISCLASSGWAGDFFAAAYLMSGIHASWHSGVAAGVCELSRGSEVFERFISTAMQWLAALGQGRAARAKRGLRSYLWGLDNWRSWAWLGSTGALREPCSGTATNKARTSVLVGTWQPAQLERLGSTGTGVVLQWGFFSQQSM